ncbi:hypothetical protein ASF58_18985 [Methylobacterium sp. Leaf125]|uniref:ABC-three component system middle component 2 n=1 Tax=Methylobacterium sp. Leaf125 TaxID=1736265 RepID=UPI0006FDF06C|nr:ABC-three component system middle component 2 [Methylobacterium sp. Leaf125]KQQ45663.1 hypothetical protein ASF58_18985 [Methylobacterium sp. Leaf125]
MRLDGFGHLYNSTLETGIRAVIVLEHLRPVRADLPEMVLFDHVVVHTGDHGGPPSLHTAVPGRIGELLVRRRLVEDSLRLMQQCHLVAEAHDADGITYQATDEAAAYMELLETPYSEHLKRCSAWIGDEVSRHTKVGFKERVRARIGDWAEAFEVATGAARRA